MKNFFKALGHAALGGFLAGGAAAGAGAGYKVVLYSGLASAITSVLSFLVGNKTQQ